MPDTSSPDPTAVPQITSVTSVSGGVNLDAGRDVTIGGDVIGRDKITIGYTVEQVSTLLAQMGSTFQPKPFEDRCPYLGLDAFSEDDADRFFGRETLVSELVARVKESRFVVIAGPSGSGKSSLVRAGLIHALKQGALPNSDHWLYATLTPGRDPIESLALAMSRMARSPDAGKYVREHSAEPDALHQFAESQLSDHKDQRAVLFVDQFEEIFTQVSKEEERLAFLNLLTNAATIENGRVTVLFALRSDFVSNCATYPQLNALLNQQFMQVGAMQPDELVSAIARPALQVGLRIDPDLVAQIVNDMQDEPGALPLMQFALKDLFDAQQAKGGVIALTLNDYLARGGLRKALERHADAAFARLSESEQQLARTIFSGLIEIGRGTQDTRRTAAFDELVPANADATQVKAVVEKLAAVRLITTDELGEKDIVTIAHERLIGAWPWLHHLVNENRDAIALQNQIAEDAQEWNQNQRDASYLYVGARLVNAREQLTAKKIVLSGLAQDFVESGIGAEEAERRAEETRRQKELDDARRLAEAEKLRAEEQAQSAARLRRRAVYLIGALAAALVLGIIAGVFGIQSNQNADTANRNAVTAEAARQDAVAQKATAVAAGQQALDQKATAVSEAHIRATAEISASVQRDEAQRQARIALSRQLAAQSNMHLENQFDLALLLSVESNLATDSVESRISLLSGLERHPGLVTFLHGKSDGTVGPYDYVSSVALSSDSRMLAAGNRDGTIGLWDLSNPQKPVQLGTLDSGSCGACAADSMAFSPDGKTLASSNYDKTIYVWDVSNPKMPVEWDRGFTHDYVSRIASVTFSPDGKTLAWGNDHGTIDLQDVSDRLSPTRYDELRTSDPMAVNSVIFSPNGQMLASGSISGTISLWDMSNPQKPIHLSTLFRKSGAVSDMAFSSDGKTLASGSDDTTISLWDISNPKVPVQLGTPFSGHTGAVLSVAFSPRDQTLASVSDNAISLWDVSNPQKPIRLEVPLSGPSSIVTSVAFSPDGQTLALGGEGDAISLWDVSNPKMPLQLGTPISSHNEGVNSVAFNPTTQALASGGEDGTISLWDVSNPQKSIQLGKLGGDKNSAVSSVAFSPDGHTLASGGCVKEKIADTFTCNQYELNLWDISQPEAPSRLGTSSGDPPFGDMQSVFFSPDGMTLASVNDRPELNLWDVSNRQKLVKLDTPFSGNNEAETSAAFSPDGRTLATGHGGGKISLWDVSNPKAVVQLGTPLVGHRSFVMSVAFNPDGQTLATGGSDATIILWDVSNPKMPVQLGAPLGGQANGVRSMAFSPDGRMLASASCAKLGNDASLCSQGEIILWDVSNPKSPVELGEPLHGHTEVVLSVAFSPDGKTLASGSRDTTIVLWDVDPASWRERACQIAHRNLTRVEWVRYLGDEPYRPTCPQWPLEPEATPTPTPTLAP